MGVKRSSVAARKPVLSTSVPGQPPARAFVDFHLLLDSLAEAGLVAAPAAISMYTTHSRRTSVTRQVDRHAPPTAASRSAQARSHRRHSSADRRQCSW